jgi:hypothetical protein
MFELQGRVALVRGSQHADRVQVCLLRAGTPHGPFSNVLWWCPAS